MYLRRPSATDRFFANALQRLSSRLSGSARYLDRLLLMRRLRSVGAPHAESIATWTSKGELQALCELAATLPERATVLEIGSYLGASSCYLAAGLARVGGHLFCADTWTNETMPEGHRDTFAAFEENTKRVSAYLTPIRKKSSELTRADVRAPLHMVFIDGDHRYSAVKSDFERVQQWLAPDGLVVFHDFGNPDYEGVTRVVGEALASGEWTFAGVRSRLVWIKRATWSTPAWLEDR